MSDEYDTVLRTQNEVHIQKKIKEEYDSQGWREYKHSHPSRGRAVIANFYSFKWNVKPREGSKEDVSRLKETLEKKLKFVVDVWDLAEVDRDEFLQKVKNEANRKEHSEGDCFLMAIMTHGDKGGELKAYDNTFKLDEVIECFTGDKCRALRRKPKIFIVQACRGNQGQEGIYVAKSGARGQPNPQLGRIEMITLPIHSDIVIAQAQYEGFYSLRHEKKGSYFIQRLCDVLDHDFQKPDDKKDDFLRLLTFVSYMVAKFEFLECKKSKNPKNIQTDGASGDAQDEITQDKCQMEGSESDASASTDAKPFKPSPAHREQTFDEMKLVKQQPTVISTLLQLLYFRSKDGNTQGTGPSN